MVECIVCACIFVVVHTMKVVSEGTVYCVHLKVGDAQVQMCYF